jgi:hypothetical protein
LPVVGDGLIGMAETHSKSIVHTQCLTNESFFPRGFLQQGMPSLIQKSLSPSGKSFVFGSYSAGCIHSIAAGAVVKCLTFII